MDRSHPMHLASKEPTAPDPQMDAYRAKVFGALFDAPPRRRFGRYTVLDVLGRGGMGIVLEGRDEELDRRVAIKLMAPDKADAEAARRQFEREAKALAHLRNDNIVTVYDYGIDDGTPYIVMEMLEGETLKQRLLRSERLSPAITLLLLQQIGTALTAAAEAGIVHRDLKPANVFIMGSEGSETVKLLDFGLMSWSRQEELDGSATQGLMGTPAYMSPEQIRGHVPHHASDLWALGVIAYELITGQLPFSYRSIGELIVGICTDPFIPPSSLVASLPPGIDEFFCRALTKDPSQRFQSATELVDAFSMLCRGTSTIRLLSVDDEPDMEVFLRRIFERRKHGSGYELLFAENGQVAIDLLRRNPDIDIVLADINMPVMDGLTLLDRVHEVAPRVKTVMVSAYGNMDNIRRAMNLGAFDFLIKPFDRKDLEATIAKLVRHISEHRELTRSERENRFLRRFTSPATLQRLDELGPSMALATETVEGTVVVVALGPYPSSEADPIRQLNANLEFVIPEFRARHGVLQRILGYEVMATFTGANHLVRALEACTTIIARLRALDRTAGGNSLYSPPPRMGIATGPLLSGCVGSRACNHLAYSTIGPFVHEAETLARKADVGQLLVSSDIGRVNGLPFAFEVQENSDVLRVSWE